MFKNRIYMIIAITIVILLLASCSKESVDIDSTEEGLPVMAEDNNLSSNTDNEAIVDTSTESIYESILQESEIIAEDEFFRNIKADSYFIMGGRLINALDEGRVQKHFLEETMFADNNGEQPNYNDMLRYPDKYNGLYFFISAKVVNISSEEDNTQILILEYQWQNYLVVSYTRDTNNPRLLVGDSINFLGSLAGIDTVTFDNGQSINVPFLYMGYLLANQKDVRPVAQAVQDYMNEITYAINSDGNFITTYDSEFNQIWKHKEFTFAGNLMFEPLMLELVNDEVIITAGIKYKVTRTDDGESILGAYISDGDYHEISEFVFNAENGEVKNGVEPLNVISVSN